jgi:hypothetical protein
MPLAGVETRVGYVVRPRMVGVVGFDEARDWDGDRRARHGLAEDPSRFAGVRPYRPGDQLRRIHWRASARTGSPLTRRYDPSRRPDVVLVLDLRVPTGPGLGPADRTGAGPHGRDDVPHPRDSRRTRHERVQRRPEPDLFLTPSLRRRMGARGDVLARLGTIRPSRCRGCSAGLAASRAGRRSSIGAVDGVVPAGLRGLARSGFVVAHVAYGGDRLLAEQARAAGIIVRRASTGRAHGWSWRDERSDRRPLANPGPSPTLPARSLVSLGEGAWIAVVYVLFEAAGHARWRALPFAVVEARDGRRRRTRSPGRISSNLVPGLVLTAVLGWLVADGAIARLLELDGRGVLALNPGGFLLGLAALGILQGRSLSDVGGTDLGLGVPAVAVAISWLLGGALADPARPTFATEAIGPTVLFVVMAPAGNAVSRVAGLARTGGFAWTGNRTWIALLIAGALVTAGLALFGTTTALSALGGVGPWLVVAILAVVVAREPSPVGRPRKRGKTALGWLILLAVLAVLLFLPSVRPPSPTDQGTAVPGRMPTPQGVPAATS